VKYAHGKMVLYADGWRLRERNVGDRPREHDAKTASGDRKEGGAKKVGKLASIFIGT
jgi:hypothetical protein